MPSVHIGRESSSCHAETGLPGRGTDSSPKGAGVMHSDEIWKQFSSQSSADDRLQRVGTAYYAPRFQIHGKLRFSKAHQLDWMGAFPPLIRFICQCSKGMVWQGHELVFLGRAGHVHIHWQDSSLEGSPRLWRTLGWGCKKKQGETQ